MGTRRGLDGNSIGTYIVGNEKELAGTIFGDCEHPLFPLAQLPTPTCVIRVLCVVCVLCCMRAMCRGCVLRTIYTVVIVVVVVAAAGVVTVEAVSRRMILPSGGGGDAYYYF